MILYPPYVEEMIPAFAKVEKNGITTVNLIVPFEMHPGISVQSFNGFVLKIKDINSQFDKFPDILIKTNNYNVKQGKVIFDLANILKDKVENLKIGLYYKIQMAYCQGDDDIGPYSNVSVVRYIKAPTNVSFEIVGDNYIGRAESETEPIIKYRFNFWLDREKTQLYHYKEDTRKSGQNVDRYFYIMPYRPEGFYIEYIITTLNGYTASSPLRQLSKSEGESSELNDILSINYDNGYVEICYEDLNIAGGIQTLLYRANNISNECSPWELLAVFDTPKWEYRDINIECGMSYKYKIVYKIFNEDEKDYKYESQGVAFIGPVYFEDLFLSDSTKVLKVRFNPQVSSFKNTVLEQKVDTIGGPYPFIFRNGNVKYKEFSINGLISYWLDENEDFMTKTELGLENSSNIPRTSTKAEGITIGRYPTTSLNDYNLTAERKFKLAVLEWLSNGKPKLFKSPTEGTYIIQLMNVSLSPEQGLGRMLHNFSATAYEIANFNVSKCSNYNLLPQPSQDVKIGEYNEIVYTLSLKDSNSIPATFAYLTRFEINDAPQGLIIEYTLLGSSEIYTETIEIDGCTFLLESSNEVIQELKLNIDQIEELKGTIIYNQMDFINSYTTTDVRTLANDAENKILEAGKNEYIIGIQVNSFGNNNQLIYINENGQETTMDVSNQIFYLEFNIEDKITKIELQGENISADITVSKRQGAIS